MARQNVSTRSGCRVAIVAGLRTPFARQGTEFKNLTAIELGQMVVSELVHRYDLNPIPIDQVVFGQVVQMPQAPNIAREIVLASQLPVATDAFSVSRACATSFQAVINVAESIMVGSIESGIAGGADSCSNLPIGVTQNCAATLLAMSKQKTWLGKAKLLRQLSLKDFLPVPPPIAEYSTGLSMGETAEQMAKTYHISRQEQDEFAHRSHQHAEQAWQEKRLDQEVMTAFPPPYQQVLAKDNTIRAHSTLEELALLKPVFDRRYGSVTAGNSTPLTDGAAAIVLMAEDKARSLELPVLGYIRSYAWSGLGVEKDMLLGPAYAVPNALDKAGIQLKDLTLFDMHEAFAAQVLANLKLFASEHFATHQLKRSKAIGEVDMDKFNVLGGSIAYGHPFAATGARLITQTLNELQRRGGGLALTTACAAGGLGVAMVLESE